MDCHLEKKIRLNDKTEHKNLDSWCLEEIDTEGKKVGSDLIPWNWGSHFTVSELRLNQSFEFGELSLFDDEEDNEQYKEQKFKDSEVITATLHPGIFTDGKWLEDNHRFSMFGTDRFIAHFSLHIHKVNDEEKEYCNICGVVSYTSEIDFRDETFPDSIEINFGLFEEKFNKLSYLISNNAVDVATIGICKVSGFYSNWSPSISTNKIKVLVRENEQEIIKPDGCEIDPPRLGNVGELDLTLITQCKINPKQSLNFLGSSNHKDSITRRKKKLLKEKLLPKGQSFFHSQYNNILKQLAERTAEFSIQSKEDEEEFENRFWDALEILDDTKSAISFLGEEKEESDGTESKKNTIKEKDHTIWFHGNVKSAFYQGYESEHAKKIDKEWMTEQAIKYLQRPWMENELLEWIFVDSLMFGEVLGLGESIKQFSPKDFLNLNKNYFSSKGNIEEMQKKSIKDYFENLGNNFVAFFVVPLLITFFLYHYFSKEVAVTISISYFCLLVVFLVIRGVFRFITRKGNKQKKVIEKSAELLDAMHGVYEILKEGTISPKYLREKLYETSKKGAVWPAGVFMVIDHAIKRNYAIWNPPEQWTHEK